MTAPATLLLTLPHAHPSCPSAQLALFAMRRIGAHGLDDAHAANALIVEFGEGFRRPLVLLRAFIAELAAAATLPITIAPCCSRRATAAETSLLAVLARAECEPDAARLLLSDLLGVRRVDGVLASAAAVGAAFADAGRPIGRDAASSNGRR